MIDELVVEVMERRPRRYVDVLQCHGEPCGECWRCCESSRGRYVMGTGRWVDLTHGSRQSSVIIEPHPLPFREEELASPWLRRVLDRGRSGRGMAAKRVPWTKKALRHLDLLPPRYFAGGPLDGEWAYVDLRQAYPSIYSRLSLDMKWIPNPDRPVLGYGGMSLQAEPELLAAKAMHRAVGGIIRSTQMTELVDGTPRTVPTIAWSRFLAPDLWGVIQWALHSMARMAIDEFGCVMWDTDGGVVPRARARALIEELGDRWGMGSVIEHAGTGTIWGVKHWDIGDDRTGQVAPRRALAAEDRTLRPSPAIVEALSEALCR